MGSEFNREDNTDTIIHWLSNCQPNYEACIKIKQNVLKSDTLLSEWLRTRYYSGKDRYLQFDREILDYKKIRKTIREIKRYNERKEKMFMEKLGVIYG